MCEDWDCGHVVTSRSEADEVVTQLRKAVEKKKKNREERLRYEAKEGNDEEDVEKSIQIGMV